MGIKNNRGFANSTKTIFVIVDLVVFSLLLLLVSMTVSASPLEKQDVLTAQSGFEVITETKLVIHKTKYREKYDLKSLPFHRSTLLILHGIPASSHIPKLSPSLVDEHIVIPGRDYEEMNKHDAKLVKPINDIKN